MGNHTSVEGRAIFNGEYHVIQQVGIGKTANVYLAESIENPAEQVAIKIFKKSLKKASSSISSFTCISANS